MSNIYKNDTLCHMYVMDTNNHVYQIVDIVLVMSTKYGKI